MQTHKRFKFVKDYSMPNGNHVPKDSVIEIIGPYISLYTGLYGGQITDSKICDSIQKFIEAEYRNPYYLEEIPVPYNKI